MATPRVARAARPLKPRLAAVPSVSARRLTGATLVLGYEAFNDPREATASLRAAARLMYLAATGAWTDAAAGEGADPGDVEILYDLADLVDQLAGQVCSEPEPKGGAA
jgi:hypothetical protein